MEEQGNLFVGFLWGALLSLPLWIAFFGWVKMILHFL